MLKMMKNRYHIATVPMKQHHVGQLRDLWVRQQVGEGWFKPGIEIVYEEHPCYTMPDGRYIDLHVFAKFRDVKMAAWYALKGEIK